MASPSPTPNIGSAIKAPPTAAQGSQGMTLQSLVSSLTVSVAIFGVEVAAFLLLRDKIKDLYQPRVSLAKTHDDRELSSRVFSWIRPMLSTPDATIIQDCGLDAFFFLRYLSTVIRLFVPLAVMMLLVLLPLNIVHGKTSSAGVEGLDRLTWAGVGLAHSSYYWAHLVLGVVVVIYFCYVLCKEFLYYIQIRQRHLTSLSSATTVLVSDIPRPLRSIEALCRLYSNIGEGVRNVWLNRDCGALDEKIQCRDKIIARLEGAQTNLIRKALKAFVKSQNEPTEKHNVLDTARNRHSKHERSFLWSEFLCSQDRESMRLPIFGYTWMPSIPLLGQKIDVIYHCRDEVVRLNVEIESDQLAPNKFPPLGSAFIQFNRPVDAHLICQSVACHIPFHFSPQHIGITPESVIWKNVAMQWWELYVRTTVITAAVVTLIVGWAVPVAFTGFLSQLSYLTTLTPRLSHVEPWLFGVIQGVLPQALLMILTSQLPTIIRLLAQHQGFTSRAAVEPTVQRYYFSFLFTQIFLTVGLSSSVTTILENIYHGFDSVAAVLATNLPKSSNYFLSYLLLQAFSMSASEIAQVSGLIQRLMLSPILDKTPRQKYQRQLSVSVVQWGTVYPVYTNLACIGIIYSIIAPLITPFIVIAFGLFWLAFRYNILYVREPLNDTGGLLYPTALNQLFTGVYVLELCLIGLFLLVRDEGQRWSCVGQAVVMILVTALTSGFQILLNRVLAPLLVFSPTMPQGDGESCRYEPSQVPLQCDRETPDQTPSPIDDLSRIPMRFQHNALLAKRPSVWLPRDELGISDGEVSQTRAISGDIWISNKGASIDLRGALILESPPP